VRLAEDVLDEELDEEIKDRIKNAAEGRKASIFGDYPIMPAARTSRLDKEGRELQQAAVNIAAECEIAMKHLAHMETASAGQYISPLLPLLL
jgi:hypothetical protein